MELYEITKAYDEMIERFNLIEQKIDLNTINAEISNLSRLEQDPNFWNDNQKASEVLKKKQCLIDKLNSYELIKHKLDDFKLALELHELQELSLEELNEEFDAIQNQFKKFELDQLLSEEYDSYDAYLEIHPGAGGTESQDWANMIYNMYLKYAKNHGMKVSVIDYQAADVGIKSVLVEVSGTNAYGLLKGENGIHRLVRISPFDSNKKRHTSFCSVKVMPVINQDVGIEINEKDLKIDRYRSSGAGGQSVNTTDSAIRITHIPTGIVVTCQNERSQVQNKAQALKILQAKLMEMQIQEQKQKENQLSGDKKEIGWGSQKRSYVLHPYKMVKDNISGYETSQAEKVLDGDIDDLLYYNLVP